MSFVDFKCYRNESGYFWLHTWFPRYHEFRRNAEARPSFTKWCPFQTFGFTLSLWKRKTYSKETFLLAPAETGKEDAVYVNEVSCLSRRVRSVNRICSQDDLSQFEPSIWGPLTGLIVLADERTRYYCSHAPEIGSSNWECVRNSVDPKEAARMATFGISKAFLNQKPRIFNREKISFK